jgi:hypothetical protein
MNISADWANVFIALLALAFTIAAFLLNSIRIILSGIRADIKEVFIRQSMSETRISVIEELLKRLKCQRCENG